MKLLVTAALLLIGGGIFVAFGGLHTIETLGGWIVVGVIALAAIVLALAAILFGNLRISHSAIGSGNSVTHNEYYSVRTTNRSGGSFVDPATSRFMGGDDGKTQG